MDDARMNDAKMNDTQVYYSIGYRDALAVLCAEARMNGTDAAVRKAAEKLLEIDPSIATRRSCWSR